MTKDELNTLLTEGRESITKVYQTIVELTKENPLILFDKDKIDEDDEIQDSIYELPYSYYVGKYQYYLPGVVWRIEGENVTLFMTGEEWGETWEQELHFVPIESRLDVLEHLIERMS